MNPPVRVSGERGSEVVGDSCSILVMSLDERNNPHIQTVLQEYIQQIEDLRYRKRERERFYLTAAFYL